MVTRLRKSQEAGGFLNRQAIFLPLTSRRFPPLFSTSQFPLSGNLRTVLTEGPPRLVTWTKAKRAEGRSKSRLDALVVVDVTPSLARWNVRRSCVSRDCAGRGAGKRGRRGREVGEGRATNENVCLSGMGRWQQRWDAGHAAHLL